MNGATGKCRRILLSISGYLDGDLEASDCAAVERHCRACARCAAVVAGLRETVGLCRQAGSAPLPEAVRKRARASIRRLLHE
jgi:anti-sigma factor RsiW